MIQENLQTLLQQLANQQITSLSEKETKQMLISLQNNCRSVKLHEQIQCLRKTKKIRRFFSKKAFKKSIKSRLPSIVQQTLDRILIRHCTSTREVENKKEKLKGGSSKFKIRTKRFKSVKQMNFLNKLRSGLKISNHQDLACPICLETIIQPTLTLCGHLFCLECIDESLLFSHTCPTCRQNIRFSEPITCRVLDRLIQTKIFIPESEVLQFQARMFKFQNWRQMRFLDYNSLRAGTLIDVRDTENIWCQGDIKRIYRKRSKLTGQTRVVSLLIHYLRWNKLYNQIIDVPSHRLAPLNCFSGRIDIPRYNLSEADGNLRGSVVSGPAIRIELANPNPLAINSHLDFLNESDEVLQISDSEQANSDRSEVQQNENQQNQQQEQDQQNQENINDLASNSDAPLPDPDFQLQLFLNNLRNRILQERRAEEIMAIRRAFNQVYNNPYQHESQQNQNQSELRVPSNEDSNLRLLNEAIQNVQQAENGGEQVSEVVVRQNQNLLENDQSEHKQNKGQQFGHDCQ